MTLSTPTASRPASGAGVATAEAASSQARTIAIIAAIVVVLFAGTYAFAWSQANKLSTQYLHDADQSYAAGDYMSALVGGQSFDLSTNKYVQKGGYLQVQHIWANNFAWPQPASLGYVQSRIDDIINHKLTAQQAQQFVQENTGKQNPYLGVIYLRLGELYAQQGDAKDARDIFQAIPGSFPNDPQLIQKSKQDLAQLGG